MKFYDLEIKEHDTGDIELTQDSGCGEGIDSVLLTKEQAKIVAVELMRIADSALKTEG